MQTNQHIPRGIGHSSDLLPGIKPVLELLRINPKKINSIMLKQGLKSSDYNAILDLCRENSIHFSLVTTDALDRICRAQHQGVIARINATENCNFSDLLAQARLAPLPLILALDQLKDVGNVGTLARTLYTLGGAGLVVPRHNSAYLGTAARKSAAGALEYLTVSQVTNLGHALDEAEENGFTIYGGQLSHNSVNVYNCTLESPAILVLGSEEKGIRPGIVKRCSQFLHIPQARKFDSLNVAQAGAILISHFAKQQLELGELGINI